MKTEITITRYNVLALLGWAGRLYELQANEAATLRRG